jgi:Xaa-Pro aminopeptidase
MARFEKRRDRIRRALRKTDAEALLVTDFTNVTYLTGFTGDDSYLLLGEGVDVILTDPRYTTQISEECPGLDILSRSPGTSMLKIVAKAIRSAKISNLGFEADSTTVAFHEKLQGELRHCQLVSTQGIVQNVRQRKDASEIARIRQAVWYAEKGFGVIRAALQSDQTEKDLADSLEHQMRVFGATGCSFPSIVAVGDRAALPHAQPTTRELGSADFVLIDWGASDGLYNSDLTRVLVTGRISPKLERIYRVVLSAQQQAIEAIAPGAAAVDVDRAAREVIAEAGFGRYFGHGLGHGLGLQVHEAPRLSAESKQTLMPGMVVTVEPGIYLPGWGGVRIEDDVLVTKDGCEVLTTEGKQWDDALLP